VEPSVCPYCGKICHATRSVALHAARRRILRERRLRVYRCPAGQGWHLTSRRPPRKHQAARERARRYARIRARRALSPASPLTLAAGRRRGPGVIR
jgi:hypothetical protein